MGYELTTAQKAAILDETGAPIPTADVTSSEGTPPPFGTAALTIQDDGSGHVELVGKAPGAANVSLRRANGPVVSHAVTISAAPFDWTLGDPTPKG